MGKLEQKAIRGAAYTVTSDYIVYAVNFIRGVILARILAPEIFGIFALANFYQGLFGRPNQIGLDQAVIQRKENLEEAYNGHLLIKLATAAIGLALCTIALVALTARAADPARAERSGLR